jgi:hypothetical protein
MKLDDLARRAAEELQEASREARFTVQAPGSRPPWARPLVALGAAAVVLAIGVPLLLLYGPWVGPVIDGSTTTLPVVTTTTAATTTTTAPPASTTEAPTTTAGPAKTPAATVDELVAAYYATGNAGYWKSFRALNTDDCMHAIYYVEGRTGTISDNISHAAYDFASDPNQGIEVLGEFFVSGDGDVVVVPVAWTYPDPMGVLTGFDVLVVRHVDGGLLVGGAATFLADDRPDLVADPAEARALIEASRVAFNADDVEGVLATMSGSAVFWEDMTDVETIHGGTALREFLTANLTVRAELTGEPVASGRFIAVPSRNTEDLGFVGDGVYVFWISDGKIALQAYAQGF